jgi:hemerythrin-like domain-containing protein
MRCIEIILQDHAAIRKGLDILDMMVRTMEEGGRIEIADAVRMVNFLQLFADEYHQTVEENILFPLLVRAAPDNSALQHLILEHAEERTLLSEIGNTLKSKRAMDFVRMSRRVGLLLRNHFNEEDLIVCDLAERSLSTEEDTMIATEFMKHRAQVETIVNLDRLEWKYPLQPGAGALPPERPRPRALGATS